MKSFYYLHGLISALLRKAVGSLSVEKSEGRCPRCLKVGMDEAVTFSGYHYYYFFLKISATISFPSLDQGVLSKCFLNLIQIPHAVFHIFPFLYPVKSWKTPALRGSQGLSENNPRQYVFGSPQVFSSLPASASLPLERVSSFERTYAEKGKTGLKPGQYSEVPLLLEQPGRGAHVLVCCLVLPPSVPKP